MGKRRQPKKEAAQTRFLVAYEQMGVICHAAKAADIHRNSHYQWLETDSEYADRFDVSHELAIESLETEARRRAFEGSDTLLIFLLKAARREVYRERYDHKVAAELSGSVDVKVTDARDRIARELAGIAARRRAAADPASGNGRRS